VADRPRIEVTPAETLTLRWLGAADTAADTPTAWTAPTETPADTPVPEPPEPPEPLPDPAETDTGLPPDVEPPEDAGPPGSETEPVDPAVAADPVTGALPPLEPVVLATAAVLELTPDPLAELVGPLAGAADSDADVVSVVADCLVLPLDEPGEERTDAAVRRIPLPPMRGLSLPGVPGCGSFARAHAGGDTPDGPPASGPLEPPVPGS